jgi:electron transfer flavoprotein alpha subunit
MPVIIYTQNWEGQFKKLTFELASYGHALAEQLKVPLIAVSVGEVSETVLMQLANYGVEHIISLKDPSLNDLDNQNYGALISDLALKHKASVVLLSHSLQGKALAPRIAVRLQAGLVSGVCGLPSSLEPLIVPKKVFTGKAGANVKVNSALKVLTLSQNSFHLVEHPVAARIENCEIKAGTPNTSVKERQPAGAGRILVTDAEIVVSGGRGMKGPENWAPLEELAQLLGGATACTRPVADEGWRPHFEHVGQTGKIVGPNLYIACGISGAIQHVAGVSSSKVIVAINKDPEAPIFEAAQYGVVGDVTKVLPELIKAVKEYKGGS